LSKRSGVNGDLPWACAKCGARRAEFWPQCGSCLSWNTFRRTGGNGGAGSTHLSGLSPARSLASADASPDRLLTGVPYLDRVLGGGFVAGSTLLLYGDPGCGKSTMALEAVFWASVRRRRQGLYVSGEESAVQVRDRTERLRLGPQWILFNHPAQCAQIESDLVNLRPSMLVVDSVQVLDDSRVRGSDQSRARAAFVSLLSVVQRLRIPAILISQVNGQGEPSGGKVYSHLPDAVFHIVKHQDETRELVMRKNRFGPILHGVKLRMGATGLEEAS